VSGVALNPEPLRVLIVDDTPDLRDLLTMALERTGEFEVVAHAENGRQAVDSAAAYQPDLVLLDIAMPVMETGSRRCRWSAAPVPRPSW